MTGDEFAQLFGAVAWELRFDRAGRAAVRIAGGPVAPRHVEPAPPAAPWLAEARCGSAAGWVLAEAAPEDPGRVEAALALSVAREAAQASEAHTRQAAALAAEGLERLTHRLRTDVTTLRAVADAALQDLFGADDLAGLPDEVARTAGEAQRRLSAAREVMTVLAASGRRAPEPVADTLRAELEAAGRDARVTEPERALTLIPGAGWAACARVLAAEPRWTAFAIEPDARGWRVTAGEAPPGSAPVAWSEHTLGEVAHAGHVVVAAGGTVAATQHTLTLVLPAAPPPGDGEA